MIDILDFAVCGKYAACLVDCVGTISLTITNLENKQMLYNLYNVLPKASHVVATEYDGKIMIVVACPYGYKLFRLSDDILGQVLFKRVDDLTDVTTQTLVYDNTFRVVSVVGSTLQIDELGPELNIVSS